MTGKSERKKVAEEEKQALDMKVKELSEAKAKADEYLDMARRLQADFENYRKRAQRDNEEYRKYATSELLADLLLTVDDLERALALAKDPDSEFVKGIEAVHKNLTKLLTSKGLEEIPTDGGFNPLMHEALLTEEGDTDGRITEVFQKGYTINGRLLRCSKVKVMRKKEENGE
jgi:molecular chaperone GrpE